MALPVNIEQLVHGHTIEWERLEFKQGWNPQAVIRSMCAFANDLHNWGGGYIVIGTGEEEGQPLLPPAGLQQNQIDSFQKEVLELGHKIQPHYFPVTQPYVLDGKHILVLWCPAGDNRIYLAPETLGVGAQMVPFVRVGSNSIVAKGETLRRLHELTARIPFDDRINHSASIDDLDLGLIQAYLHEVKSDLYEESKSLPFEALCRMMLIAKGPNEDIRPVNASLLFFSAQPHQFFDRSWIELVWHQDMSGNNYREVYFKGPLHKQLRDALSFIKTNILTEQVIKLEAQAEALRFYNFPFAAVEEALSNAVYHKSYELRSPIEIQVWPDKMEVLSYPGPVPPVNASILRTHRRIVAREYRNRRIGDFLKELRLTEGRGTGLPTIYEAMKSNGSPVPIFDTDEDCTYFLATLLAHDGKSIGVDIGVNTLTFNNLEEIIEFSNGAGIGAGIGAGQPALALISNEIHDRVPEVLGLLIHKLKRSELFDAMDLSNQTKNRAKYLDPLITIGWVAMEYPNEPTHPGQTYHTTASGKRILNLINQQ